MGAMIDAWLLGWLGGQQGCRCQQKYVAMNYGGAFVLMPQMLAVVLAVTQAAFAALCLPGSACLPIAALYALAGQARHAINRCR